MSGKVLEEIPHLIAKVESTSLGLGGHGIWTAMLQVNYGGSSQGIGGYALDAWVTDRRERIGTAYGMKWIMRVTKACGVDKWEDIKGRTILVYRDGTSFGATVVGIGPLPTEPGEPFLFAEVEGS